jgi:FkbM family methyltransferase
LKEIARNIYRRTIKKYRTSRLHRKESFSQTGEDLIVHFIFNEILKQKQFNYFDVGAHHPTFLSNTALFYKLGLRGVCIEPDPLLHADILKSRKRDICLNIGIGFNEDDQVREPLDFFIMSARTLNTFSREEAERLDKEGTFKIVKKQKIDALHLHKLFQDYFVPDFLSIDVEGIDLKY